MKKVTMTFVVDEATILEAGNELEWGNYGNAVAILEDSCVSSEYNIQDCPGEEENDDDTPQVVKDALAYVRENMDEDDLVIIKAKVSKNLKNRNPAWYGLNYEKVEQLLFEYGEEHDMIDENNYEQEWWEKYGDIDDMLMML